MSDWKMIENPAWAGRKPEPLTGSVCHDHSHFVTVQCHCGEQMHMHETQWQQAHGQGIRLAVQRLRRSADLPTQVFREDAQEDAPAGVDCLMTTMFHVTFSEDGDMRHLCEFHRELARSGDDCPTSNPRTGDCEHVTFSACMCQAGYTCDLCLDSGMHRACGIEWRDD